MQLKTQSHLLINHALIFNFLSKSICVNALDHLELYLDFLPSLLYKKDEFLLYKKSRFSPYRKDLVEVNIDISKLMFGYV